MPLLFDLRKFRWPDLPHCPTFKILSNNLHVCPYVPSNQSNSQSPLTTDCLSIIYYPHQVPRHLPALSLRSSPSIQVSLVLRQPSKTRFAIGLHAFYHWIAQAAAVKTDSLICNCTVNRLFFGIAPLSSFFILRRLVGRTVHCTYLQYLTTLRGREPFLSSPPTSW